MAGQRYLVSPPLVAMVAVVVLVMVVMVEPGHPEQEPMVVLEALTQSMEPHIASLEAEGVEQVVPEALAAAALVVAQ